MPDGLSKVRVLVVDANAHMRTIVSSVLIAVGVGHVRECADGAEALKTLEHWQTDIAIVDYRMAPIDGLEFTRLVRNAEDSVNPYLPIIMLTGDASRQMVLDARDAGVTEFVAKPMNAQAILDRLNNVIFKPRSFVKTADYFGPDRRRKQDESYNGPWRREGDASIHGVAMPTAQI